MHCQPTVPVCFRASLDYEGYAKYFEQLKERKRNGSRSQSPKQPGPVLTSNISSNDVALDDSVKQLRKSFAPRATLERTAHDKKGKRVNNHAVENTTLRKKRRVAPFRVVSSANDDTSKAQWNIGRTGVKRRTGGRPQLVPSKRRNRNSETTNSNEAFSESRPTSNVETEKPSPAPSENAPSSRARRWQGNE